MNKFLILLSAALIAGCSSTVSTKLVNKNQTLTPINTAVYVLEDNEAIPANSQLVGKIKIGDSGFSMDCGYNKALAEVKKAARKAGANIIKITQVKEPNVMASSCYRIKADVYRNVDEQVLSNVKQRREEKNKSRLPADSDYAVIYFYRPHNNVGGILGYKINTEKDSIVGRVRDGEKFAFRTKKFGRQTFYGELETKEEVTINIEKGQEYFVRCGVRTGAFVGRPEIGIVENVQGIKEYKETQPN
jgi:hypothetical protein